MPGMVARGAGGVYFEWAGCEMMVEVVFGCFLVFFGCFLVCFYAICWLD